jgi:UTP-glucose-1-phosphate uridylyltransferase
MKTLCILPAAGNATRMNGLPKFSLPIDENNLSLIENHIRNIEKYVDKIIIATKEENLHIFNNLKIGDKSEVIKVESISMSDTVLQVINYHASERYILLMPDTYFMGENPHQYLANSNNFVDLIIFPIKEKQKGKLGQVEIDNKFRVKDIIDKSNECNYKYAWGALGFDNELLKYLKKEDPHIGYAVKKSLHEKKVIAKLIESEYFDCGTPNEYFDLIRKI